MNELRKFVHFLLLLHDLCKNLKAFVVKEKKYIEEQLKADFGRIRHREFIKSLEGIGRKYTICEMLNRMRRCGFFRANSCWISGERRHFAARSHFVSLLLLTALSYFHFLSFLPSSQTGFCWHPSGFPRRRPLATPAPVGDYSPTASFSLSPKSLYIYKTSLFLSL